MQATLQNTLQISKTEKRLQLIQMKIKLNLIILALILSSLNAENIRILSVQPDSTQSQGQQTGLNLPSSAPASQQPSVVQQPVVPTGVNQPSGSQAGAGQQTGSKKEVAENHARVGHHPGFQNETTENHTGVGQHPGFQKEVSQQWKNHTGAHHQLTDGQSDNKTEQSQVHRSGLGGQQFKGAERVHEETRGKNEPQKHFEKEWSKDTHSERQFKIPHHEDQQLRVIGDFSHLTIELKPLQHETKQKSFHESSIHEKNNREDHPEFKPNFKQNEHQKDWPQQHQPNFGKAEESKGISREIGWKNDSNQQHQQLSPLNSTEEKAKGVDKENGQKNDSNQQHQKVQQLTAHNTTQTSQKSRAWIMICDTDHDCQTNNTCDPILKVCVPSK